MHIIFFFYCTLKDGDSGDVKLSKNFCFQPHPPCYNSRGMGLIFYFFLFVD